MAQKKLPLRRQKRKEVRNMKNDADTGRLVARLFMDTDRLHHRVADRKITALGVHRSQHMMLMELQCHSSVLSQREIAKRLNISPTAVAVKIKKLESEGLIARNPCQGDCRANSVYITEKGMDIVKRTEMIFNEIDSKMLAGLSKEQLDTFYGCLKQIQQNLTALYASDNDAAGQTVRQDALTEESE